MPVPGDSKTWESCSVPLCRVQGWEESKDLPAGWRVSHQEEVREETGGEGEAGVGGVTECKEDLILPEGWKTAVTTVQTLKELGSVIFASIFLREREVLSSH